MQFLLVHLGTHEHDKWWGQKFVFTVVKKIEIIFLHVEDACMYVRVFYHTEIQKYVAQIKTTSLK